MALTPELIRIYASAPVNTSFYEGLVLTHPYWAETIAIITNTTVETTKNVNGVPVIFYPANFGIVLPRRDDLGLVQLSINFPIITRSMMTLIELAEGARTPITATMLVYIDGSPDSQLDPVELQLDQIAVTEEVVTGVATRVDLLNKVFPRALVRTDNYPGLYR